jgi:hypothetical protein
MRFSWNGILVKKFIIKKTKSIIFFFDYNYLKFFKKKIVNNITKNFNSFCRNRRYFFAFIENNFTEKNNSCFCRTTCMYKKYHPKHKHENRYWPNGDFIKDFYDYNSKIWFYDSLLRIFIENNSSKIFFSKNNQMSLLPPDLNTVTTAKKVYLKKKETNLSFYLNFSKIGILGSNVVKRKKFKYYNNLNHVKDEYNAISSKILKYLSNFQSLN